MRGERSSVAFALGTVATQFTLLKRAMKKEKTARAVTHARNERVTTSTAAGKAVTVLHVDDNPNDTTLLQVACAKADVNFKLHNIGDGGQVIEYLNGVGKYADRARYQLPGLVLLDLKMARVEGLEVLKWIRNHSTLKNLPVIVLSGSELEEDISRAYAVGANSYQVKPPNLNSLINFVQEIGAQLASQRL